MERCIGGVSVDTIVARSYAFYGECEPTDGTDGLWFDGNARVTQQGTGMTLADPEHRISTIGVTTADRPQLLERCLVSLTRQVKARGTSVRLIVVDASRSARNEALGRLAVSVVTRATGQAITFIGRPERVAVRRALGALCADSLLEFAFRPCASGNRNIVLLLTTGENLLLVDDDMVCDTWRPRSLRSTVVLGGHIEQRNIEFYGRRQDVCKSLVPATVDLLTAHERVIGQTVRSLATSAILKVDRRPACVHLREAARGVRQARVRLTFSGLAGDAGVSYPDRLLFSTGKWRAVLGGSRGTFDTAFTFREVCKVATRYVVMHEVSCMSGCMGLSNTSMAPPFLPTGRNEDGLFGATLSAIDGQTVSCHVPYAVIHASNRSPRYLTKGFPSTSETRLADLLISLIWSARIRANESRRRLTRLGQWLQDLAALPAQDFVSVTSLATLRTRERELTVIESALENPDTYPPYWQRNFRAYRTLLLKNLQRSTFLLPLECHRRRTVDARYGELQQFVRSAGELYVAWPVLWAKARSRLNCVT
ncbi:MAG: hypothetical protein ACJ731_00710 [Vicinamibacterales bacterium]